MGRLSGGNGNRRTLRRKGPCLFLPLSGLAQGYRAATKVIVAQRISSIRHADLILVLEEGRVIGRGNHETLLGTCPVYRQIASTQMGVDSCG